MSIKCKFDYDDDRVELPGGLYAKVKTDWDQTMGPPWEEHDGHGPVSEWTSRDKRPGERLLVCEGSGKRYYDFAEATVIAKRDGWGIGELAEARLESGMGRKPTRKEIVAAAVEDDFKRLSDWANDRWHWIGVIVTLHDADDRELRGDSVWGIEDDTDYWKEVASDLTEQLLYAHDKEATEAAHWAARDVITT